MFLRGIEKDGLMETSTQKNMKTLIIRETFITLRYLRAH